MLYEGFYPCAFNVYKTFARAVHGAVCSIFFYTKQKARESLRPFLERTILCRNYLIAQQLPASSPFFSKLIEYIIVRCGLQEFL